MCATYHLNTDEIDQAFLEDLKATFGEKRIQIVVHEIGETEYLLKSDANRERLLTAKSNIEQGKNLVVVNL